MNDTIQIILIAAIVAASVIFQIRADRMHNRKAALIVRLSALILLTVVFIVKLTLHFSPVFFLVLLAFVAFSVLGLARQFKALKS